MFQTRKGALLTAVLVPFQPQFIFICGIINNDVLASLRERLSWKTQTATLGLYLTGVDG